MKQLFLTSEQEMLQSSVKSFARDRLSEEYLLRAKQEVFPREIYQEMAGLGLLSLMVGEGRIENWEPDYVSIGIVFEELAYRDFNVANCLLPGLITSSMIALHGSDVSKDIWLDGLVSGELLVGLALTEPGSGSDAAGMSCSAKRVGNGWTLNGEKTSVSLAKDLDAVICFAKSYDEDVFQGISCFLVPMNTDGVQVQPIHDTGWAPIGRGSIVLNEVHVDDTSRIGSIGSAFRSVMIEFDWTRPILGLAAVATAQAAIDDAVRYVQDRKAFGKPLYVNQGVSFPLAEHTTYLHLARLLCYDALHKRNLGMKHTTEAAMSKWYAPLVAGQAIHQALLLHGHYGYSVELPFEQRLRDVLAVEIADGTAQIQKMIISRDLFHGQVTT